MMYNNENLNGFLRIKKVLALFTSIGLILVSIWFSQQGFGIESGGEYEWVGWFLGFVVTVVQLVFNTSIRNLNPTLIGSGILAYGYGIYTNVTGLKEIFSGWGFAIIVGLIIEVLAEPLFAWSIGVHGGGDVIGNLGSLFGFENHQTRQEPKQEHHPQTQYLHTKYPPVQNQHKQGQRPPNKDIFNRFPKK